MADPLSPFRGRDGIMVPGQHQDWQVTRDRQVLRRIGRGRRPFSADREEGLDTCAVIGSDLRADALCGDKRLLRCTERKLLRTLHGHLHPQRAGCLEIQGQALPQNGVLSIPDIVDHLGHGGGDGRVIQSHEQHIDQQPAVQAHGLFSATGIQGDEDRIGIELVDQPVKDRLQVRVGGIAVRRGGAALEEDIEGPFRIRRKRRIQVDFLWISRVEHGAAHGGRVIPHQG